MNTITGIWKLVAQDGDSFDVLALENGRILAIGRGGIELWPDYNSFVADDSDFAEMLEFIEHDLSQEKVSGNGRIHHYSRFGETWVYPLVGSKIRNLDHRVITLLDGSRLEFAGDGTIYLNDEKGNPLGLIFNEDD